MILKNIKVNSISIFFFCLTLSLFFSGCTKEEVVTKKKMVELDPSVTVTNGHLNFQTVESFKNLMKQMQENEVPTFDNEEYSKFEEKGFRVLNFKQKQLNNNTSSEYSKSSSVVEVEEDTLIADSYFAAVLNENKEIEVDGFVYKVDEYGTFYGPSDKLEEIDAIINELDNNEANTLPGEMVADKLYQVSDDIYLYDSFNYNEPDEIGNSTNIIEIVDPASSSSSTSPYGDIVTYKFEAKTLAGKVIEYLFGRSRAHNREFNWRRRIRVNFYNVNYVVYSAIGVNVKFQKKNWIGWSTTECSELRWGWDGFQYSFKLPYSMPTTGPAPVQTQLSYVPGMKLKVAFTANFWNHNFSYSRNLEKDLKNRLLKWWSLLEERYAPDAVEMRKSQLKQFREIFPDRVVVDVDRYEEIQYNCTSFSKVFDWGTCEASINFLSGGSWVLRPGLKNNALSFDVNKASFYGIAKYDGRYKGVRILKE